MNKSCLFKNERAGEALEKCLQGTRAVPVAVAGVQMGLCKSPQQAGDGGWDHALHEKSPCEVKTITAKIWAQF